MQDTTVGHGARDSGLCEDSGEHGHSSAGNTREVRCCDRLCAITKLGNRTRAQRPADPASWELLKQVIDAANVSIPVIVNGDVFKHEDVARVKLATGTRRWMTGVTSVIDRTDLSWHFWQVPTRSWLREERVWICPCSARNKSARTRWWKIICAWYVHSAPVTEFQTCSQLTSSCTAQAIKYDAVFPNAKYVLQHMTHEAEIWPLSTPHGHALNVSKKYQDLWYVRTQSIACVNQY